jgi:hypothetical protein
VPQSFLEVARELIDSPEAKSAFAEDPDGFLAAHGLDELSTVEFEDAVGFVADVVPVPVARQVAEPSPDAAPEPAALARLAATSVAEDAARESEPGTIDFAAVVDPGGELDVPQAVDLTALTPSAAADEPDGEANESAVVAEEAVSDAPALGDDVEDAEEPPLPDEDPADTDGDEAAETEPTPDPFVDPLEPEVADAGLGDVPIGDAVPAAPVVEPPPEDITIDDLI